MKLEKWQIKSLNKIEKESKEADKLLLDIKSSFLFDLLDNSKIFKSMIKEIDSRVDEMIAKYRMTNEEQDNINILIADLMTYICKALSKEKSIYIVM